MYLMAKTDKMIVECVDHALLVFIILCENF